LIERVSSPNGVAHATRAKPVMLRMGMTGLLFHNRIPKKSVKFQ
jgi:hypothetical protein